MGGSESQIRTNEFQKDYIAEIRSSPGYLGQHILLINRHRRQILLKKQFIFQSSGDYNQFVGQMDKIERKPFNVIYPRMIIDNDSFERCSTLHEVAVYSDFMSRNISQIVKQQGHFPENKAWFLLNQVSKSLEILSESGRPHWAITPETIFENNTQNYFIYDSLFVLGLDPQNFLVRKWQSKEAVSEKMQIMLERGAQIGASEGYEQDMYCLGLTMLFTLTGVHPNSLPKTYAQRQQSIRAILQQKRGTLSADICQIVQMLSERETSKRMDNYQLRRLLKERQAEIIHNENDEFQRSKRKTINEMSHRDRQRKHIDTQRGKQLANQSQIYSNQNLNSKQSQFGVVQPQYQQLFSQKPTPFPFQFHSMAVTQHIPAQPRLKPQLQQYNETSEVKRSQMPVPHTQLPSQMSIPSDRPLPRIHSFDRLLQDRK